MVTYANENLDYLPKHQGAEPNYLYVRGSLIDAPGSEWHLGELLMPHMNMEPPQRGTDDMVGTQKFAEAELQRKQSEGKVFYCPSTGNGDNLDRRFPTWGYPSAFGSFMDYAQFWGLRQCRDT